MMPTPCLSRPSVVAVIALALLVATSSINAIASENTAGGVVAPSVTGGEWPQWRGIGRDGHFTGPAWPDKLGDDYLERVWSVELGPSYSGPIVAGNRVFTTETRDKKFEVVTAFDRRTGEELWSVQWEGALSVPFFAKSNGDWIRATPACDGESLFVAGMRDVLVCLDVQSGKERWRFDFVRELDAPLPDFGFVCSPMVDGEFVYVQAGASFVKLNKRNGAVVWRTLKDQGGMWGSVFSSPVIADLAGKRQLVVQSREKLAGVDPADGRVLWEQAVKAFRGMNILTPVVHGDMLFTSTYGGRTIGFEVNEAEGRFTVREAWRHKAQGYMSTPVVIGGVAYCHLKSQRMMAIEIETGRELWTSDRSFGKYMSFVARDDRILALDQRGILYLVRANRAGLDVLGERGLTGAETWGHLAVAGRQVFVRELDALSMFQWTSSSKTL